MPADGFDPYHKWLGIPPEEQSPTHYRLLGIVEFAADPDVIANTAARLAFHLRQQVDGPQAALAQRLLNEVATAKRVLLNPEAKAQYDQSLAPAVGLSAIDIVVAPTFRRKPVKSDGFRFIPKSLLASVVIGATLLLLLYLSEQRDGLKPDRVAALPSQLPDNGSAVEPTPPAVSPAAAHPPLTAGAHHEPGDRTE